MSKIIITGGVVFDDNKPKEEKICLQLNVIRQRSPLEMIRAGKSFDEPLYLSIMQADMLYHDLRRTLNKIIEQ